MQAPGLGAGIGQPRGRLFDRSPHVLAVGEQVTRYDRRRRVDVGEVVQRRHVAQVHVDAEFRFHVESLTDARRPVELSARDTSG